MNKEVEFYINSIYQKFGENGDISAYEYYDIRDIVDYLLQLNLRLRLSYRILFKLYGINFEAKNVRDDEPLRYNAISGIYINTTSINISYFYISIIKDIYNVISSELIDPKHVEFYNHLFYNREDNGVLLFLRAYYGLVLGYLDVFKFIHKKMVDEYISKIHTYLKEKYELIYTDVDTFYITGEFNSSDFKQEFPFYENITTNTCNLYVSNHMKYIEFNDYEILRNHRRCDSTVVDEWLLMKKVDNRNDIINSIIEEE